MDDPRDRARAHFAAGDFRQSLDVASQAPLLDEEPQVLPVEADPLPRLA